ncbi:MAG: hypothetical protein AAF824_11255 [Bacteroidota bacterium]
MREVSTILLFSFLALVQICEAQSIVIHPFGAVNHQNSSEFEVFPKQTGSKILLLLPSNLSGNCNLKLVDRYGKAYWRKALPAPHDAYVIELASSIPPGSYRLFLTDASKRSYSVSFQKM